MKFRAALAMVLALALSAGGALAQVRTTGNVNLRSGPGLDYEIVGSVEAEAELEYLGETSTDVRGVDWYLVAYDGGESWISSRYAELGGVPAYVNLRSGPGLDYEIVGFVEAEAELKYLGEMSTDARGVDWYLVAYDGGESWISSRYAEPGGVPAYDAEAAKDWEELSDYYLRDLQASAGKLGLTHYEETPYEEPYQYSNDAVTIAGYDHVSYMGLWGPGYTIFGAACGMPVSEARANMEAAGLQFDRDDGNCMRFEHPADERSFANCDGHDSCLYADYIDDVVTHISWSTYTG